MGKRLLIEALRRDPSGWVPAGELDGDSVGTPPDIPKGSADRIVVRSDATTVASEPTTAEIVLDVLAEKSSVEFKDKAGKLDEVILYACVRNFLQGEDKQKNTDARIGLTLKAAVINGRLDLRPHRLEYDQNSFSVSNGQLLEHKLFRSGGEGKWRVPEIAEALGLENELRECGLLFTSVRRIQEEDGRHFVRLIPELRGTAQGNPGVLRFGHLGVKGSKGLELVQRLWLPGFVDGALDAPWGRWLCEIDKLCDDAAAVAVWNDSTADPHVRSLRMTAGDEPISIVPHLDSEGKGMWTALFAILDPGSPPDEHDVRLEKWWQEGGPSKPASPIPILLARETRAAPAVARAGFRGIKTWSGGDLTYAVRLRGFRQSDTDGGTDAWRALYEKAWEPSVWSLELGFDLAPDAQELLDDDSMRVRLGAVDLGFSPGGKSTLEASFRVAFAHRAAAIPRLEEALVHLPLQSFAAAGQDPRPEERSVARLESADSQKLPDPALVLPRREAPVALVLVGREETDETRHQTLNFSVEGAPDDGGETELRGSSLILDTAPFLVAGVEWRASTSRASGETSLAAWSNPSPDGVLWRIRTLGMPTLFLPSQTLGESMERSRRPGEGVPPRERADLRLGPPAAVQFATDDLPRQFTEAPWNLRRLLERPGEGRPGVRSENLRVELLYGIQVDAPTPGLRIAESFARMGSIPGPLPEEIAWTPTGAQRKLHDGHRSEWEGLTRRYGRRLAVLELVDPDSEEAAPIEAKVRARLRDQALQRMRPPHAPSEDDLLPGGALWGIEARAVHDSVTRNRSAVAARLERVRLSALGGWGEQAVAFDEGRTVIRSTTSMGRAARIQYERIGRIGVYWNRAKHVVVYERTTAPSRQFCREQTPHLGRPLLRKVQEFVELLQENRTFPDLATGGDKASGSTLELGPVRASAFVARRIPVDSRWGSDVFDPSGTKLIGWRVPLWRDPLLHPEVDAQVYPRPVALLDLATDGPPPDDRAPAQIRDPDQLCFFTDTVAGHGANTDAWPAVLGVDFADEVTPTPEEDPTGDRHDLDRPLADAPSVPAGLGAFTFAVLPARRPANLVAGRADRALGAALDNVTMMRANPLARPGAPPWAAERIREFSGSWLTLRAALPRAGKPSAADIARMKGLVGDWIRDLDKLKSLPEDVLQKVPSHEDLCARVKQRVGGIAQQAPAQMLLFVEGVQANVLREVDLALAETANAKELVKNALHRAGDMTVDALARVDQSVAAARDELSRGMGDALAAVRSFRMAYDEEVASLRRQVDRLAARPAEFEREWKRFLEADPLARVQARLLATAQRLVEELRARLEGGFSQVADKVRDALLERVEQPVLAHLDRLRGLLDLDAVRAEVERLEWLLGQTVAQATDTAAKLDERVERVFAGAGARLADMRGAVSDARSGVRDALEVENESAIVRAALVRIQARLAADIRRRLDDQMRELERLVSKAGDTAVKAVEDLGGAIEEKREALSAAVAEAIGQLDLGKPVGEVKTALRKRTDELAAALDSAIDACDKAIGKLLRAFREAWKATSKRIETLRDGVDGAVREANVFATKAFATVDEARQAVADAQAALADGVRRADEEVRKTLDIVETTLGYLSASTVLEAAKLLDGTIQRWTEPIERQLKKSLDDLASQPIHDVQRAFADAAAGIDTVFRKGDEALTALELLLTRQLEDLRSKATYVSDRLDPVLASIAAAVRALLAELEREVDVLDLAEVRGHVATRVGAFVAAWRERLKALDSFAKNVQDELVAQVCELLPDPRSLLEDGAKKLREEVLEPALKKLQDAIDPKTLESARRLRDELEARFRRLEREVAPALATVRRAQDALGGAKEVYQHGAETLRLLRAFGSTPIVPDLHFNRERIGYYFAHPDRIVEITPMVALANRVGDELKAMGLRVPTRQLLDQVVPDRLRDLDLSSILPDFGGLKLDGLFGGLRFPEVPSKNVRITHGLDRESLRAWLEATVDVEVTEPATIFSIGALAMATRDARFVADVRVEADPSGVQRRRSNGAITASWLLRVGGRKVVTFKNTKLSIDEAGKLRFDLSPSNVQLEPPLDFISDALSSLTSSGSGLSIRRVQGPGIIAGAEAVLALPLPDVQAGAFAMTGLMLGGSFGLVVTRADRGIDFALSASVNVATKARPFALTIAFLSGGGWLDVRATYWPLRREMAALLSVGIHAGARAGISLGPISGSVYFRFGIAVEFSVGGRQGSGLTITVFLGLGGEVQALGFISVALDLLLEASYGNGRMVGRGSLSIRVRICWCFTFSFETSVEYVFAGGSKSKAELLKAAADGRDEYDVAAGEYVELFA